MTTDFDVAVAGAGPAGSVAAYILARKGYRVLLVDPERSVARKVGECLPGAARTMLRDLNLEYILDDHIKSFGNQSCWGSDELLTHDFIQDPFGHGWHLDRVKFDLALRRAAEDVGVERRIGRLAAGDMQVRWLIDATGRSSMLARKAGAIRFCDDDLTAIYVWLPTKDVDQDRRTFIEAIENGWWYSASLADESRVLVLHLERGLAQEMMRDASLWHHCLEQTHYLKKILPPMEELVQLRSIEACGSRLDRFYGQGWLAVGDAALAFDPISSQGIFKAIYTGIRGAEAVAMALDHDDSGLKDYARRLENIRLAYLQQHVGAYGSENRWSKSHFWQKRQLIAKFLK